MIQIHDMRAMYSAKRLRIELIDDAQHALTYLVRAALRMQSYVIAFCGDKQNITSLDQFLRFTRPYHDPVRILFCIVDVCKGY